MLDVFTRVFDEVVGRDTYLVTLCPDGCEHELAIELGSELLTDLLVVYLLVKLDDVVTTTRELDTLVETYREVTYETSHDDEDWEGIALEACAEEAVGRIDQEVLGHNRSVGDLV